MKKHNLNNLKELELKWLQNINSIIYVKTSQFIFIKFL